MEWLNNKSLKQSFFVISILHLCVGLLLAIVSFLFCSIKLNQIEIYPRYEIAMDESGSMVSKEQVYNDKNLVNRGNQNTQLIVFGTLQFALPICFVVLSLVAADITFYKLKLKKPLAILQKGAMRIQLQDLDFEIETCAKDELGQLSDAFEKMRKALLSNQQTLWRQMEERKRLNAAFSHDLRNPITVLKGSVKLARESIKNGENVSVQFVENLTRIEEYTKRIEQYVETMSSVQRLEQIPVCRTAIKWEILISELKVVAELLAADGGIIIEVDEKERGELVFLDKAILLQVAENLLSNALRFARHTVFLSCRVDHGSFILKVSDDGDGFAEAMLRKGILPFSKGREAAEHFGMGLYICELLCKKHGGELKIGNYRNGAMVLAVLNVRENLSDF